RRHESAVERGDPVRNARDSDEEGASLLRYATSWLRPLSDWLRGDSEDDVDRAGDGAGDAVTEEKDVPEGRSKSALGIYEEEAQLEEELVRAHPLYEEAQNSVEHLILELEEQRTPDLDRVRNSVAGLVSSVMRNPDAVIWLNRLKRT